MSEKNSDSYQPTDEEMKAKRQELIKFYKEQLPLLKVQAEYEETITRIEGAKVARLEMMIMKAQILAPPPESKESKESNESKDAPDKQVTEQNKP